MDNKKLKPFLMWCTIINGSLLVMGFAMCIMGPDLWYGMHSKLFHIPVENIAVTNYLFLGFYKIFWLIFNAVPYVALLKARNK